MVAADANLALGAVTLGTGTAALVDAIKGPTAAKDSEGLLASAAAASNTSRGFLPTTASIKVADLLGGALTYAEFIYLTDDDLKEALLYPKEAEHGRRTKAEIAEAAAKPEPPGDYEMIKLARVHDAVFAACGANAYGLVPSRKPFK